MTVVKTAISLPEQLFAQVEEAARAREMSRSEFIARALAAYFAEEHLQEMRAALNAVYGVEQPWTDDERLAWRRRQRAARADEEW